MYVTRNIKLMSAIIKDGRKPIEIAAEIGVNRSSLSRWVSCEINPGPASMERLIEILGVDCPEDIGYRQVPTSDTKTTRHFELTDG